VAGASSVLTGSPVLATRPTSPSPTRIRVLCTASGVQTLGGAELERLAIAEEVDRADLGAHRIGDQVGDPVKPGLPRALHGQRVAQAAKELAALAFGSVRHGWDPPPIVSGFSGRSEHLDHIWRDEAAILAWRRDAAHRRSQTAGRNVHFSDYRIRVGARVAHWQAGAGTGTAADGVAANRAHLLVLYGTRPVEAPGAAGFESVTRPGRFVTLAPAGDMAAAEALLDAHAGQPDLTEAAAIRISRDYGMHDRAEAPEPAG
jgi:hypothetical protein